MKYLLLIIVGFLFSCDHLVKTNLEKQMDTLEKGIENKLEQIKDTAKTTINRWEDSLDHERNDTSRH